MGLFDRWRRKDTKKKVGQTRIRGAEIVKTDSVPSEAPEVKDLSASEQDEVVSLVAEYERLSKRREELQEERGALTKRLDSGELTAIEFRKLLMEKIQEAAQVSDSLKSTSSRLTALGYRGVLH
jgi:hypothetical protein